MVFLLICSFVVSLLTAVFIIRLTGSHAKNYDQTKPQRFHFGDVPRLGGVGLLLGVTAGWLIASAAAAAAAANLTDFKLNVDIRLAFALTWVALALPAVLGGFYEDVTQRLSARYRLTLTALSAALACYLLGL